MQVKYKRCKSSYSSFTADSHANILHQVCTSLKKWREHLRSAWLFNLQRRVQVSPFPLQVWERETLDQRLFHFVMQLFDIYLLLAL